MYTHTHTHTQTHTHNRLFYLDHKVLFNLIVVVGKDIVFALK